MEHWMDEYVQKFEVVEIDYKLEWDAMRYCINGKMFAMRTKDKEDMPIITIKLKPENGEKLRYLYPEQVVPGYYMNKVHWNSFYYETDLPQELIKDALEEGYEIVLKSLSKKQRDLILAEIEADNL